MKHTFFVVIEETVKNKPEHLLYAVIFDCSPEDAFFRARIQAEDIALEFSNKSAPTREREVVSCHPVAGSVAPRILFEWKDENTTHGAIEWRNNDELKVYSLSRDIH